MGFPRALLGEHESVVFDLKPHWLALLPSALWTIVFAVAALLSFNALFESDGVYEWWEISVTGLVLVGWAVLALAPFLRWQSTHFVLTSDRLITRQGVIAKHSKEIPLERINDVAFSQSIVERFIGAGDLMIESAGERGQTRIANVRKPEQVQLMIYKGIEANSSPEGTAERSSTAKTATIPEQIEALARLRKQGIISPEEFEAKKRELLERL